MKEGNAPDIVIAAHAHASGEGSDPGKLRGESCDAIKRKHNRLKNTVKARKEKVTVAAVVHPCPVGRTKTDRNVSREMRQVAGDWEEACDVAVTVRPDTCIGQAERAANVAEVGGCELSKQSK